MPYSPVCAQHNAFAVLFNHASGNRIVSLRTGKSDFAALEAWLRAHGAVIHAKVRLITCQGVASSHGTDRYMLRRLVVIAEMGWWLMRPFRCADTAEVFITRDTYDAGWPCACDSANHPVPARRPRLAAEPLARLLPVRPGAWRRIR